MIVEGMTRADAAEMATLAAEKARRVKLYRRQLERDGRITYTYEPKPADAEAVIARTFTGIVHRRRVSA